MALVPQTRKDGIEFKIAVLKCLEFFHIVLAGKIYNSIDSPTNGYPGFVMDLEETSARLASSGIFNAIRARFPFQQCACTYIQGPLKLTP